MKDYSLDFFKDGYSQPYCVVLKNGYWTDIIDVMLSWCSENFGHRNEKFNNPRWAYDTWSRKFKFKNEKDAMMFMLRWS